MAKIAVAFSGGMDSTYAAMILKSEGNQVTGFTMEILPSSERQSVITYNAKRAAGNIGIPHETVSLYEVFSRKIIDYFCDEYTRGRTPNPCAKCNHYVKFGSLLDHVVSNGFDYIASGHYAQIDRNDSGFILRKGIDPDKDQSYFLYMLNQDQLRHLMLPMGKYKKSEVRRIVSEFGLFQETNKESQEICFVADNDYKGFIMSRTGYCEQPGPIFDTNGKELGKHKGLIHFTVGQRRGIGISAPEPLYVVRIDADENSIVVGKKSQIYKSELFADHICWINDPPGNKVLEVAAKIRYSHNAEKAYVYPMGVSCAKVVFDQPQMAVTPGQSVVFYEDDILLGGGTIR